ncbi:MAG: MFS transporter, partial [Myxococcota bacterium]
LVTVVGFTVFNTMTAFVTTTTGFVLCQFAARIFLTAEYSLAIIVIGEEYPARLRGRAIAILTSLATIGVMLMSKIQPYILLSEGEESNWLHSAGIGMVTTVQAFFGFDVDESSWRGLYVLSAFPLVLVLFLRIGMRETRRFSAVQSEAESGTGAARGFVAQLRRMGEPWAPRYRRRTAIVTLLWNCVHLVTAPSVVYWVIFAREDLGLTTSEVGDIVFWGYGGGVLGHFVAGELVDRLGRKWTCSSFYVAAACSIYFLYHVPTLSGQYLWMFCTVFSFGAAITATHVYASELFPTEIRATGYGWTTNFAGRVTDVLTPMVIGLLIVPLGGIPEAITVVAAGPIIGAILVLRYAPETKGMTLEEVQWHLDRDAAVDADST